MVRANALVLVALGIAQGVAAQSMAVSAPNTLTTSERAAGWRLLFDGKSTDGWRGYGMQAMPAGWQAAEGALVRVGRGTDIVTLEKFQNFELTLEWRLDPASANPGNSGIFFRAVESSAPIYHSAPEVQILDDGKHGDGKSELTSAGSNFALHAAPRGVVKPVGEWNAVRLLVNGSHVEHWLNGRKIVEYELGSPAWRQLVANSKFREWPEYGTAREGYIGLQEHGSYVAFRNVKIRALP
jgi:alpha-3'-ketoglucosidase